MKRNQQLHADVARLRRAATRKISRLKMEKRVELSGTKFDPRRPPRLHSNYTARELREYRKELEQFVNRRTQYVGDAYRRPMRADKWQKYKQLERTYNANVAKYFDSFSDIKLPNGESLAERMYRMTPPQNSRRRLASVSPYDPPDRKPFAFVSEKKLDAMIAQMQDRNDGGYFERLIAQGREQFAEMAKIINNPTLTKSVGELTDEQFAALWQYTGFARATSMMYLIAQASNKGEKAKRWEAEVFENESGVVNDLAKWAKSLKTSGRL